MGQYLPKPNTDKETYYEKFGEYEFVCTSMQGWRTNMEDAHLCKTNLGPKTSLFCVFDGHGGNEISQFCATHFSNLLIKNKAY